MDGWLVDELSKGRTWSSSCMRRSSRWSLSREALGVDRWERRGVPLALALARDPSDALCRCSCAPTTAAANAPPDDARSAACAQPDMTHVL